MASGDGSRIAFAAASLMPPLTSTLFPFLAWRDRVNRESLRADLGAGVVGALVVLPQAVAFATLAGLPPQYGLYCAMLPVAVAALWGSSWHQISGPTNTISLAVFATVAPLAVPGSPDYVRLVLTLTLLVGLLQVAMGLARLGTLVNFISHTVVVGFTAGAGLLIIAAQLRNFSGVPIPSGAGFFESLRNFIRHAADVDPWTAATGILTLAAAVAAKRWLPRVPSMIVAMLAGGLFGYAIAYVGAAHVPTIGALPSGIPSLSLPSFDPEDWRKLAPAALALTALALTQAVSVARAVAAKSGQRIDSNQEFIGQGLSNVAGAFTSGYPSSGSFNRIWVNYDAGARTPLAAVFSAVTLLAIVVAVAPLAAHLPLATMAALLFVVAWGLIDIAEMRKIARASHGEALVLGLTFLSTLALQLEFAIFVGVLASLFVYLNRTTHPRLIVVTPDPASPMRRFNVAGDDAAPRAQCPQLALLRVDGSLFFGAVEHVRDELHALRETSPERPHILLIGSGINFVDVAGGELVVHEAKLSADSGGALYLTSLKGAVREVLERGGFVARFGSERVFVTKDDAIRAIYRKLDPAICRTCTARIFLECATTLPDGTRRASEIPAVGYGAGLEEGWVERGPAIPSWSTRKE
jgi:sulfate permease, SulP family